PLVKKLAQSGRSLNIRVEPVSSMMIVYSAEFGKVALDGTGPNSPFTEALLRHIGEEGESISDMMIEVRNDVRKGTGNQQQPIESTQLTGQFFFKPAPAKSSSTDAEIAALRQEIARQHGAVEVAAGAACTFAEEARRGDKAVRSDRSRSRTLRHPAQTVA